MNKPIINCMFCIVFGVLIAACSDIFDKGKSTDNSTDNITDNITDNSVVMALMRTLSACVSVAEKAGIVLRDIMASGQLYMYNVVLLSLFW